MMSRSTCVSELVDRRPIRTTYARTERQAFRRYAPLRASSLGAASLQPKGGSTLPRRSWSTVRCRLTLNPSNPGSVFLMAANGSVLSCGDQKNGLVVLISRNDEHRCLRAPLIGGSQGKKEHHRPNKGDATQRCSFQSRQHLLLLHRQ